MTYFQAAPLLLRGCYVILDISIIICLFFPFFVNLQSSISLLFLFVSSHWHLWFWISFRAWFIFLYHLLKYNTWFLSMIPNILCLFYTYCRSLSCLKSKISTPLRVHHEPEWPVQIWACVTFKLRVKSCWNFKRRFSKNL